MTPLVSIIIPTYNDQLTIKDCLQSIINQTYKNLEIVVINDGSFDSTKNILDNIIQIDSRIQVINQKNQGVAIARNNGIFASKGEFVLFVDADDWIDSVYVETLIAESLKKDTDLVICGWNIYKEKKNKLILTSTSNIPRFYSIDQMEIYRHYIVLFNQGYSHGPVGKLYKNSIIKANNITFPNYRRSEDIFFNNEYIQFVNKISCISDELYNIRIVDSFVKIKKKSDKNHLFALNNHFITIRDIEQSFSIILKNWNINAESIILVNFTYMKMIINHLTHLVKLRNREANMRIKSIINDDFTQKIAINSKSNQLYYKLLIRLITMKYWRFVIIIIKIKNIIKRKL